MFVAIIAIFMLPDFPHNSRGFTKEELQLAQLRMLEDVRGCPSTSDKACNIANGQTGEVDVDSREDKWYAGFNAALTVSSAHLTVSRSRN